MITTRVLMLPLLMLLLVLSPLLAYFIFVEFSVGLLCALISDQNERTHDTSKFPSVDR